MAAAKDGRCLLLLSVHEAASITFTRLPPFTAFSMRTASRHPHIDNILYYPFFIFNNETAANFHESCSQPSARLMTAIPASISTMPASMAAVNGSLKRIVPKTVAVTGSTDTTIAA